MIYKEFMFKDFFKQKAVLWEVFSKRFCTYARQECAFLMEMGLWPRFLDCEANVIESKAFIGNMQTAVKREHYKPFSDECKVGVF